MLKTLSIFLGLMIVSASAQAAPACEQNRTVTCLAHDGRVVSNSYCDQHTDKIGQATTRLQQTCRLPEEVVQTETRETVKRCTKPWQIGNYTIRERQVTTETVTCDVTVGEWENPPITNSSKKYSKSSGWGSSSSGTSAAPHAASSSSSGNSFLGGLVRKASSLAQDYIRTASTPETVITPCKCKAGYVAAIEEDRKRSYCSGRLEGKKYIISAREKTYDSNCQVSSWSEWEIVEIDRTRCTKRDNSSSGNNPAGNPPSRSSDNSPGVASYVDTDGDGRTDTATLSAGDGNYNGGNSLGGSTSSQVSVQNNNDGTTSVRGNDTSGGGLQTGGVVNPR